MGQSIENPTRRPDEVLAPADGDPRRRNTRRHRFPYLVAIAVGAGVVLAAGLLVTVRTTSSDDPGATAITTTTEGIDDRVAVVLLLVVAAAVIAGIVGIVQILGGDGEAARLDAAVFTADADQRELVGRWLTRARWARSVGGLAGLVAWALGSNGAGDLLLFCFGGIAIGAIAAELHHVRRRSGPATAGLEVRTFADYLDGAARRSMATALLADVAVLVVGVAAGRTSTVVWSVVGLAALGAVLLVQRRVVRRPRPGVSERLRRADDLVRWLAVSRGLAQPGSVLVLALAAHAIWSAHDDGVGRLAALLIWIVALANWWRTRGLRLGQRVVEAPV